MQHADNLKNLIVDGVHVLFERSAVIRRKNANEVTDGTLRY